MQKKFILFDKQFDIGQQYIRLLIIIFVAAVLAKGAVFFRGYAVDDYLFISDVFSKYLESFFSQGRYITAATIWIIDIIGVNINDMYFFFGIVTLFFQAVFVLSILRFVGVEDLPAAGLVGAIMIAHPYLTEILTFRAALPGYSISLIFSILVLEMVKRSPATWRTRAFSILATFAMLLTYQLFLNYFAVVIIFAFLFGHVLHNKNGQSLANNNVFRERAITLTIVSGISAIAFLSITRLTKAMNFAKPDARANFISFDKIPERIEQISSSLARIYWSSEPIFPGWLKALVSLMLVISIVIIFRHLLTERGKTNSISVFFTFFVFLLLIPASLGVIVALDNWWPVPRVISHVAIIIGLIFLVADSCLHESGNRFLKSTNFIFRSIVLVGFVILSNQILADQQRINQWDKMMANRIISRLEMHPNFNDVQFVYINGGSWDFPAKIKTMQGDMNISAFFPEYSKVYLLSEVSGYRFKKATGYRAAFGESYCEVRQPWPHAESITIDNDLAVICLKK